MEFSRFTFYKESRLNSIEVYAVIFHYVFIKDRARATFARLFTQGASYFETRKVIFLDKVEKPILFEPIKAIRVNSCELTPSSVTSYQGIPLEVVIQGREELTA